MQAEAAFASLVRSLHQGRVLDASGEYQVVPNLAPGSRQLPPRFPSTVPDIAVVTQCSFNHLHHILRMVQRWQVGLWLCYVTGFCKLWRICDVTLLILNMFGESLCECAY